MQVLLELMVNDDNDLKSACTSLWNLYPENTLSPVITLLVSGRPCLHLYWRFFWQICQTHGLVHEYNKVLHSLLASSKVMESPDSSCVFTNLYFQENTHTQERVIFVVFISDHVFFHFLMFLFLKFRIFLNRMCHKGRYV